MAHSFGKVLLSTQLACGFATAVDGRVDKIIDNLAVVRPTFMGAAPRIFEKAHGRIVTMQAAEGGAEGEDLRPGVRGRPARWTGSSARASRSRSCSAKQHALFDKLVFSKIRDRFGGRVRFFISGAAALNRDIAEWFHAAGILILEGYGLTETSAGSFVNHPDDYKFGTVGPVFPGTEVKIAEDGEILIKGPGVMDGYHNLPEATAETLTDDGWLRTGDIGEHRRRRLPDASPTARRTCSRPRAASTSRRPRSRRSSRRSARYASQFLVHGSERNYCIALITLDPDAMTAWAAENGMEGASYTEIVQLRQGPGDGRRLRRRAQRARSTAGRRSRSGSCSTTT